MRDQSSAQFSILPLKSKEAMWETSPSLWGNQDQRDFRITLSKKSIEVPTNCPTVHFLNEELKLFSDKLKE